MLNQFDYMLVAQGIAVTTGAYWTGVIFYTLIPVVFPRHAAQYKMQPNNRPIPAGTHVRLVLLTLFNQIAVAFVFISVLGMAYDYLGGRTYLHFPPWPIVLFHFILYAIAFDVLFYAVHRLLHTRLLYRWIHSFHHRFRAPVPYSAACVHPVEFVLAYLLPNLTAAIVFDFSFPEYLLFLSIEYVHTVHDHCGYHYPWDPFGYLCGQNAQVHDEHHRLFRVNYSGAFTMVLDHLFGTYSAPQKAPFD